MFSGQGSQYYWMGKELYEKHKTFHDWMEHCSTLAAPRLGISLTKLLFRDRPDRFEPFDRTLFTFPAVFIINYSLANTLINEGIKPAVLLGYSMGEFVALTIGEALTLEESLQLVIDCAELVEDRTQPAGMMVVLASPAICSEYPQLFRNTTVTCRNYAENFVIAGQRQQLEDLGGFLSQKGVLWQILPIRHGFHSPFMDPIEEEFKSLAFAACLKPMRTSVFSSVYSRELNDRDYTPNYFWDVFSKPVDFSRTVKTLEQLEPHFYVDVGPSGTLASFVKYIIAADSPSRARWTINQFGKDLRSISRLKSELL